MLRMISATIAAKPKPTTTVPIKMPPFFISLHRVMQADVSQMLIWHLPCL